MAFWSGSLGKTPTCLGISRRRTGTSDKLGQQPRPDGGILPLIDFIQEDSQDVTAEWLNGEHTRPTRLGKGHSLNDIYIYLKHVRFVRIPFIIWVEKLTLGFFLFFVFFYFQMLELISSLSIHPSWSLGWLEEDYRDCNFITVHVKFFKL